jgi:hypothetical protein
MRDSQDPQVQRARGRREFWKEYVVPTAHGLESFAWRVVIGGLVIYLIFRSLCP